MSSRRRPRYITIKREDENMIFLPAVVSSFVSSAKGEFVRNESATVAAFFSESFFFVSHLELYKYDNFIKIIQQVRYCKIESCDC